MTNDLVVYTEQRQREVAQLMGFKGTPPQIQLLFQLAERYNLDPLTKEIALIPNKGPFIGVWGRLHIAQRSGLLDGIEADDETEDERFYKVRCVIWRKDMGHPAAKVIGRVAKTEHKDWPLEIARARALRAALGFAFSIHDIYDTQGEDDWTPPPDERIQATVVDVPGAATPPKEDESAAATTKPTRNTRRGGEAPTDITSEPAGHQGVSGQPPPGSLPADPPEPPEGDAASKVGGSSQQPPSGDTLNLEPPTIVTGGRTDAELIAIKAKAAGIEEDDLRNQLIAYITGGDHHRATDITDRPTAKKVMDAFDRLATGQLELSFMPNGTPYLARTRR